MIYTISNDKLSASIDSRGAELRSLVSADGTEYIWQRDPRYWASSSPVLFPCIARLYEKSYTYMGQRYSMDIHGFASRCQFGVESMSQDFISFVLRESEETLEKYPFRFSLCISYRLSGSRLDVYYHVKNLDSKLMPFAIGAHPGINVPFAEGTDFEDYYLLFDEACAPERIGFTEAVLLSGESSPYPLEDGRRLPLSHSLFDDDAIIMSHTAKQVTLGCSKLGRTLCMSFPGFDYFGIWHKPNTEAPYICLEPWTALPGRQDVIEELCEKPDMFRLEAGEEYESQWSFTISEV